MGKLAKIFGKEKCDRSIAQVRWFQKSSSYWIPVLEKSSIRLVLFERHVRKGTSLILDSKRVTVTEDEEVPLPEEQEPTSQVGSLFRTLQNSFQAPKKTLVRKYEMPGRTARAQQPDPELLQLQEQVFGATPVRHGGGDMLKIHTAHAQPSSAQPQHQVMVSKLFTSEEHRRVSRPQLVQDRRQSSVSAAARLLSLPQSLVTSQGVARSVPLDVPGGHSGAARHQDDSGHATADPSPAPSPGSTPGGVPSRRPGPREVRMRAARSTPDVTSQPPEGPAHAQRQYGLAVILQPPAARTPRDQHNLEQLETFVYSHVTMVERHVGRVQRAVTAAAAGGATHRDLVQVTMEAHEVLAQALQDLYTAPRLSEPVWLGLAQQGTKRTQLTTDFLHEFMGVVERHDNKNTSFFVSKLLTAVLTYHLAWVPTVAPADHPPLVLNSPVPGHHGDALSDPYSPLWAQLCDVHGALGWPLTLSKTVVVGRHANLVCQLLHVLTYFIRCAGVTERRVRMLQAPIRLGRCGHHGNCSCPTLTACNCGCHHDDLIIGSGLCVMCNCDQPVRYEVGQSAFFYRPDQLEDVFAALAPPSAPQLHRVSLTRSPPAPPQQLFVSLSRQPSSVSSTSSVRSSMTDILRSSFTGHRTGEEGQASSRSPSTCPGSPVAVHPSESAPDFPTATSETYVTSQASGGDLSRMSSGGTRSSTPSQRSSVETRSSDRMQRLSGESDVNRRLTTGNDLMQRSTDGPRSQEVGSRSHVPNGADVRTQSEVSLPCRLAPEEVYTPRTRREVVAHVTREAGPVSMVTPRELAPISKDSAEPDSGVFSLGDPPRSDVIRDFPGDSRIPPGVEDSGVFEQPAESRTNGSEEPDTQDHTLTNGQAEAESQDALRTNRVPDVLGQSASEPVVTRLEGPIVRPKVRTPGPPPVRRSTSSSSQSRGSSTRSRDSTRFSFNNVAMGTEFAPLDDPVFSEPACARAQVNPAESRGRKPAEEIAMPRDRKSVV